MYDLLPCALIVVGIALLTDLEARRIPNGLTFPAIVFGLLAQLVIHGVVGLGVAMLGLLTGVLLLVVPFALGLMGAGDVKLLGAVGVFLGPLGALGVVLIATASAGLLAALIALRQGQLGLALRGAARCVRPRAACAGSIGSLPFAVPIAVGTALVAPFWACVLP